MEIFWFSPTFSAFIKKIDEEELPHFLLTVRNTSDDGIYCIDDQCLNSAVYIQVPVPSDFMLVRQKCRLTDSW